MGTMDKSTASLVKRRIKIVEVTGYTAAQIENAFNNNWGNKGWRIVQAVVISNKTYLITEQEY